MTPRFLTLDEVVRIHRDQLERHGGSDGIRDTGLLESAIAMPLAAFGGEFLPADLFELAAAYLFHVVENHPFVDANKRAGTATALVFLESNGFEVEVSNERLAETVLGVAEGRVSKADLAMFFREHSRGGGESTVREPAGVAAIRTRPRARRTARARTPARRR